MSKYTDWDEFKSKLNLDVELIILDEFASKNEKKLLNYRNQNPNKLLVFEDWWLYKQDIVKSILLTKAGSSEIKKYYARKLEIRNVSSEDSKVFLVENHLQGNCQGCIRYGLYDGDELIQLIVFGKARFNNTVDWELLRLVTKKFCTVVGGTQRLWKRFLNVYPSASVVSYDDDSIFTGNVYNKLGFICKSKGNVGYCYYGYDKERPLLRIHRSVFQKHKLAGLFGISESEVDTEYDTCIRHGLKKIIDCGQGVYTYNENNAEIDYLSKLNLNNEQAKLILENEEEFKTFLDSLKNKNIMSQS